MAQRPGSHRIGTAQRQLSLSENLQMADRVLNAAAGMVAGFGAARAAASPSSTVTVG